MRILVLGGSGVLGRAVTAKAVAAGHTVVSASRRPPAKLPAAATAAVVDVTSGNGLAAALTGADAIIDGTNASRSARAVLVDGTRRTLEAARDAGVRHFVGISIVGIDGAPLPYYRVKVEQEKVIHASPVPWSLLRATQFHNLVVRYIRPKLGVVAIPRGWRLQPIDVREVASLLVQAAQSGPQGRLPDSGGPEVTDVVALAREWRRAHGQRSLIVSIPVPGKKGEYLRSGDMCTPHRAVGKITFAQWLAERGA
ncbi:MAG TPA: NAD(P)H-binding protein [Polyangiaceae bacterium]